MKWNKALTPGRVIILCFAVLIAFGAVLLALPIAYKNRTPLSPLDVCFTSFSAVCTVGLTVAPTYETFSAFGQGVLLFLIQVGGVGITSIGVGVMLLAGKRIGLRERILIKETLNYPTFGGVVKLLRSLLLVTFGIEGVGAICCFPIFYADFPLGRAIWLSVFHSVSTFNHAGFDIIGDAGMQEYTHHASLLVITALLTIFGGLGFFVIRDVARNRRFRKFSLHTKVVLTMTAILLVGGTLLMKLSEGELRWLQAFFYSAISRTSGFSIYPLATFSNASLFLMVFLMFIGASTGSTSGGIKDTTLFVCVWSAIAYTRNRQPTIFHRRISQTVRDKAVMILLMGLGVVMVSTFLMSVFEPDVSLIRLLFEVVSAFSTTGLSTDLTSQLCSGSKIVLMLTMYIGRLGPLTVATLWMMQGRNKNAIQRPEGTISVG